MEQPPEKISGLIRLAVADARGLKRERYSPHYGEWHTPNEKAGICQVCFAGAVMAGTLGESPEQAMDPFVFSGSWEKALNALEMVRQGNIVDAAHRLHQTEVVSPNYQLVETLEPAVDEDEAADEYPEGWRYFRSWTDFLGFLQRMEGLATRLEAHDL